MFYPALGWGPFGLIHLVPSSSMDTGLLVALGFLHQTNLYNERDEDVEAFGVRKMI